MAFPVPLSGWQPRQRIGGSVAMTDGEAGGNGFGDETFAGFDGTTQIVAQGKIGGNGGGELATGTVGVPRGNPGHGQLQGLGAEMQDIHRLRARQVSAFDQASLGAVTEKNGGGFVHGGHAVDVYPGESSSFGYIGRHQQGQGQELIAKSLHGVLVEKCRTALRQQDRINDQPGNAIFAECRDDHANDFACRQHPGLRCITANVGEYARKLLVHEGCGSNMNRRNATSILCGKGSDRAHPVHAVHGEGLEVGLNASPAAGIRAGDGQCAGDHRIILEGPRR